MLDPTSLTSGLFDYSLVHWATFLAAALALNLAPGPDIAFILGQTVARGRRVGTAAMVGIWTGATVHVAMAAVGLSAVLATSAMAFTLVKWVGAAYLLWLGISALRNAGGTLVGKATGLPDPRAVFRQGVLVAALNPKVAIFYLAFLPQFVTPGAGPVWAQLVLHGTLVIVVAACVETPLVWGADRVARLVRGRPAIGVWIDRALGGMLVALGVKLATTNLQRG